MVLELPARPDSPGRARVYVERVLLDRCPHVLVEAATLLASELLTNAVQHARTSLTLSVSASRDGVRLEVSDGSTLMPELRDAPTGSHGRGLVLVDRLAHSWGAEPRPDGKIVWLELKPRNAETAFAEAARS